MTGRTLALATTVLLAVAAPAAAADPATVATRVSEQVMSPYCPGVTLHDCASTASLELRRRIEGWAEDGLTEDAILDRLEAEFGPAILAVPDGGIPIWLLPGAALAGGAGAALYLLRRWTGPRTLVPAAASTATPAERARLEAALDDLRGRA